MKFLLTSAHFHLLGRTRNKSKAKIVITNLAFLLFKADRKNAVLQDLTPHAVQGNFENADELYRVLDSIKKDERAAEE